LKASKARLTVGITIAISSTLWNRENASTSRIAANFILKNTDKGVGTWPWDAKVIISEPNQVGITDTSWNATIVAPFSLVTNKPNLAVTIKIAICGPKKG